MTSRILAPYETDPAKIPPNDLYADFPLYGRYRPRPNDFKPLPEHNNSTSSQSLKYWEQVLAGCDESTTVYPNELEADGRDVFAIGSLIIKSGHLHTTPTRDYSYNDANEVAAIALARKPLAELGIRVPEIYFSGKIYDRDVLIQERIPGVGLNVAHPYLSTEEMDNFKAQARAALTRLSQIKPPTETQETGPSYVFPAPDPVANQRIHQKEADILFSKENRASNDLCLMHNDFTESNCIVNNGKIVGLVDWEMAGFFSWETAGDVHVNVRTPRKEKYAQFEGKPEYEGMLRKMFFWKDLYQID